MQKTDPKVKGKTKAQETTVEVEYGTTITSSDPGPKEIMKSAKQTTKVEQNNKEQESPKANVNGKEKKKIHKERKKLVKSKVEKENGPGVFMSQPIPQEKKDDLENNKTKKATKTEKPRTKLIQIQPKQTIIPIKDYDDDLKKKKVS